MLSKTTFAGLCSAAALFASQEVEAKQIPWTCSQLEQSTDSYYRMFPAFLGSATPYDSGSHSIKNLHGHCFNDITIYTTFKYLDEEMTQLGAKVTFDLQFSEGLCIEHLQISTAYRDHYSFYFSKNNHTVELEFKDLRDVIDIHKNGLRFFTYCADPFSLLTSTVSSAFMWLGGNGTSKYIPLFGYKPTNY